MSTSQQTNWVQRISILVFSWKLSFRGMSNCRVGPVRCAQPARRLEFERHHASLIRKEGLVLFVFYIHFTLFHWTGLREKNTGKPFIWRKNPWLPVKIFPRKPICRPLNRTMLNIFAKGIGNEANPILPTSPSHTIPSSTNYAFPMGDNGRLLHWVCCLDKSHQSHACSNWLLRLRTNNYSMVVTKSNL